MQKATLILIFFHYLQAQSQIRIVGKIYDSSNVPLPSATIKLMHTKDTALLFLKGTLTDMNGRFALEHDTEGDFIISISRQGFKSTEIPVTILSGKNIDIGIIKLDNEVRELSAVKVIQRKSLYEYTIDRILVNVQANPVLANGTALEILERSPGVTVNKQKNLITLNGKEGLIIMIDGKRLYQPLNAVIQMLAGMPAGNIEKIELISTPPASYDAGSNGGVINIILRKNYEIGTNGSFTATVGYGQKEKTGATITLNKRSKSLNIFGNFSFFRDHTYQYFTNDRLSDIQGEKIRTYTTSDRDPISTNFNGRIGFDYSVNKRLSIGGFLSGGSNVWKMKADNNSKIDTTQASTLLIKSRTSETNHWQNIMSNVNLSYKLSESQQINFDFNYLYYYNNDPTNYSYNYYELPLKPIGDTLTRARKTTPINIYVAKIDYIKKWAENKWESGIKGTFSQFGNTVSLETMINNSWVNNPDFTKVSYLNEDIPALYTSVELKLNETLNINAGLRYEYTNSDLGLRDKGSIVKREYGNLFPTIFVSKKLSVNNTLQFSYGRRITRPTYGSLAPFIIFLDPTTYFYGNEHLNPALSDAVKLSYLYKKIFLSVEFNHENNAILRYEPTVLPGQNVQVITSLNLKYRNALTLLLSLPFTVAPWWNMDNSFMGINQQIKTKHLSGNIKLDNINYKINSTQSFRLPSSFTITLSGYYQSQTFSGLSKAKPYGTFDIGAQKKIQKGNAIIRFSATDIFWTATERNLLVSEQNNLNIYGLYKYEPRVFRISYTYNFGNSKMKKNSNRETGSEEIMKRVK